VTNDILSSVRLGRPVSHDENRVLLRWSFTASENRIGRDTVLSSNLDIRRTHQNSIGVRCRVLLDALTYYG